MEPVPRVSVRVTGIPSGAATLTVWRSSRSGLAQVRSAVEARALSPFTVVDYTVPWNEDVTYWAEYATSTGVFVGETERAQVRVVFFGSVLQQPLDPVLSTQILDLSESAHTISRSTLGEHLQPGGGGLPVWLGQGVGGVSTRLRFALESDARRAVVKAMFGTRQEPLPPILCLRTSLPVDLPQPFIFLASETAWESWDHFAGGELTVLEWDVTETTEPALGLLVAPFSYEDLEAAFSSYEDMEADPMNATYEALEERTDLAGVA